MEDDRDRGAVGDDAGARRNVGLWQLDERAALRRSLDRPELALADAAARLGLRPGQEPHARPILATDGLRGTLAIGCGATRPPGSCPARAECLSLPARRTRAPWKRAA